MAAACSSCPTPRTAADSWWVAVMVNSCAPPSPGSCSAFGMVIPPAGTRARSLVERSWTSSGNQKENRCLEQHKGNKTFEQMWTCQMDPQKNMKKLTLKSWHIFRETPDGLRFPCKFGELLEVLYDVVADPKTGRPRAENATSSVENPCFSCSYAQTESNGSNTT